MVIGIMQPYLLPYIGYFQLINAVDKFVIYDNIEYTKKGWINRNRYLLDGKDIFFTLPLKNASDFLDVRERSIADNFNSKELLNKITAAYRRAPYFNEVLPIFRTIVEYNDKNLFQFILHSVQLVTQYLDINTELITSSAVNIDHSLRGQDKVLAICKELKADRYINAIGGMELYSREVFKDNGIELNFIKSRLIEYRQFDHDFVPWLSILDLFMFNDKEAVKSMLNEYELV